MLETSLIDSLQFVKTVVFEGSVQYCATIAFVGIRAGKQQQARNAKWVDQTLKKQKTKILSNFKACIPADRTQLAKAVNVYFNSGASFS